MGLQHGGPSAAHQRRQPLLQAQSAMNTFLRRIFLSTVSETRNDNLDSLHFVNVNGSDMQIVVSLLMDPLTRYLLLTAKHFLNSVILAFSIHVSCFCIFFFTRHPFF